MASPLGELLKAWRTAKGLSLEALFRRSGISGATVSRWETGRTQPRLAELSAVLTALGVSDAQKRQVWTLIEAPRAVQQLRRAEGDAPPVGGDLLRAMRLRQGWTQQEAATRTGVTQGTLGKWERSEDWPSTERLHALCAMLGAHEEETLALTCGRFSGESYLQALGESDGPLVLTPTLNAERLYHLLGRLLWEPESLSDLGFLALEARLWKEVTREADLQTYLCCVYARHARYLVSRLRYAEAAPYIRKSLAMAEQGRLPAPIWVDALLSQTWASCWGSPARTQIETPLRQLKRWQQLLPELSDVGTKACVEGAVAHILWMLGEGDSALRVSVHSIVTAEREDRPLQPPHEVWQRHVAHAARLEQAGQPGEALRYLLLDLDTPDEDGYTFQATLTAVRAHRQLGHVSEAQDWLLRAQRLVEQHGLTHDRPEVERLLRHF
jgi:transcriptional regulator with XRE-family HTH domain